MCSRHHRTIYYSNLIYICYKNSARNGKVLFCMSFYICSTYPNQLFSFVTPYYLVLFQYSVLYLSSPSTPQLAGLFAPSQWSVLILLTLVSSLLLCCNLSLKQKSHLSYLIRLLAHVPLFKQTMQARLRPALALTHYLY